MQREFLLLEGDEVQTIQVAEWAGPYSSFVGILPRNQVLANTGTSSYEDVAKFANALQKRRTYPDDSTRTTKLVIQPHGHVSPQMVHAMTSAGPWNHVHIFQNCRYNEDPSSIPVPLLTSFLQQQHEQHPSSLKVLQLSASSFTANEEGCWQQLAATLPASLESFSLKGCKVDGPTHSMDCLLQGLAVASALQTICIRLSKGYATMGPVPSPDSWSSLCRSALNLTTLDLRKFAAVRNGQTQNLAAICQALEDHATIRELFVQCHLGGPIQEDSDGEVVARLLRATWSLQRLELVHLKQHHADEDRVEDIQANLEQDRATADHADPAERIRAMKAFMSQNFASFQRIAAALAVNTSLEMLEFCGPDLTIDMLTEKSLQEFVRAAERNYTLHRLKITPVGHFDLFVERGNVGSSTTTSWRGGHFSEMQDLYTKMDWHLKLNRRVNRGAFLQPEQQQQQQPPPEQLDQEQERPQPPAEFVTQHQWLDKLIEVRDDLDCVHFLLTINPSIYFV